jgi:hypothetical protein
VPCGHVRIISGVDYVYLETLDPSIERVYMTTGQ